MAAPVGGATADDFTRGGATALNIRALEKELLALWKSAAEVEEAGGQAVTRAAVLTLIAVVSGDEAVMRTTAMIAELTEHAPCRAILVHRRTDEAGPPLEAYASAHCHRVGGGRQVCCEQITIHARAEGESHVTGLVVPLLIPDLPVYLYWPDALVGEHPPLLDALARQSDFVILDSARAGNPEEALRHLDELASRLGPGPRPRDLNWSRLTAWRDMLADLFESPDRRPWLADVATLDVLASAGIACEGPPIYPARPLLFAGWFIRRLGWRTHAVRAHGEAVEIEADRGRRVTIHLDGFGVPKGKLLGLHLRWSDGREVIVECGEKGFHVAVTAADGTPLERRITRGLELEGRLLCDQLDERGVDAVFREALREAAEAAQALAGAEAGPA